MAYKIQDKLVDFKLEADVPQSAYRFRTAVTVEQRLAIARDWLSELKDFLNQHKDHPGLDMEIQPIYKDVCSHCEREWEVVEEFGGQSFCANCGEPVEQSP